MIRNVQKGLVVSSLVPVISSSGCIVPETFWSQGEYSFWKEMLKLPTPLIYLVNQIVLVLWDIILFHLPTQLATSTQNSRKLVTALFV